MKIRRIEVHLIRVPFDMGDRYRVGNAETIAARLANPRLYGRLGQA